MTITPPLTSESERATNFDASVGSDRDHRLELQEALLADALHVHQLLHLLEGTIFLAVIHDELRGFGADAWQRLQLRGRRGVDVDRRRDRGRTLRFRGRLLLSRDPRRSSDRQERQHPDPDCTHVILLLLAWRCRRPARPEIERPRIIETKPISVAAAEQGGEVGPR